MPANKFATIRYHVIDKMLRNKYKPYPSVEDIMEKCSDVLLKPISKSSIEKDIRAMKNDEGLGYFAPIEYSRNYKGYYYEDESYSIDKVPLNEDEIEAVKFATNILTQFKNIDIFKDYENAIEKVLDKVNLSGPMEEREKGYIQFENAPTVSGNQFLAPLLNAIRQRKMVEFSYQSFKSDQGKSRVVAPYLLKEHKNRWYLLALEGDTYKMFGLERMNSVELKEESFVRNMDFDAAKYFQYAIGITVLPEAKAEVVRFEAHPVLLQYLESQPIHSSQNIDPSDNGGIVTLHVMLTFELEQLLLGYGDEVKVLEPKVLIDRLKQRHLSALNNY